VINSVQLKQNYLIRNILFVDWKEGGA